MDTPVQSPQGDNQDKLLAFVSCFPILFWVPILMDKKSPYVSHFMKHSFGLLVIAIAMQIITSVLWIFVIFLLPIFSLIDLILLWVMIYMMYGALTGSQKIIPYYTEYLNKALVQFGIESWFQAK